MLSLCHCLDVVLCMPKCCSAKREYSIDFLFPHGWHLLWALFFIGTGLNWMLLLQGKYTYIKKCEWIYIDRSLSVNVVYVCRVYEVTLKAGRREWREMVNDRKLWIVLNRKKLKINCDERKVCCVVLLLYAHKYKMLAHEWRQQATMMMLMMMPLFLLSWARDRDEANDSKSFSINQY